MTVLPKKMWVNAFMLHNHFRYTLIFITRSTDVLMIHRRNPPNQGLWNGVGGRLEAGESPLAGALREVHEETGYKLPTARFVGVLTWEGHTETPGGLYIFAAEAPEGVEPHPTMEEEGELAWKPRDWVLHSNEVVNNIHDFGPFIFGESRFDALENIGFPSNSGTIPDFHFVYAPGDQILSWQIRKFCP
jgi:8-oxo-dGTP diphosphatase